MRHPVRVSLAALLVVATTMVTLNMVVASFLTPDSDRAAQMLAALQDAEAAMVDQETGLRGYLITRDEQFLQPYWEGAAELRTLDVQFDEWSKGDAPLGVWLEQLHAAEDTWIQQWATPLVQAQPAVGDSAALSATLLRGKQLFDRYRDIAESGRIVLEARRAEAVAQTRLVLALGTAAGLFVAVVVALAVRRVNRRVSGELLPPIRRLRRQLSDLTHGDPDHRLVPAGPVELQAMAADVNTLSDALRLRGELVAAREEQLVAARDEAERAGQAKTAFLATMSHEIRTPLNAVLGLTDLLLTTELSDAQRTHLETVSRSGDSLLTLINDVLDFSKIEAGELDLDEAPFDLAELVYGVGQLFAGQAAAKGIELLVDVRAAEGRRHVVGDGLRLRQVLMNLVANAIKFTPRGHVVIRVTGESRDGGVQVHLAVLDTGIGIPEEHHDRLFRSFSQVDDSTTRAYGGTGLGLAISERIVHAMGGTIALDSEPAVGSTFTVSVPLGLAAAPAQAAPDVALAGCRVLAVDDDPTNLEILEHQLTRAGATVVLATTPEQALTLLAEQPFDVCLLDQHMPGTRGETLAGRIRETPATAQLPLVLLSSLSTVPASSAGLFVARLHKPVHPDRLLQTLCSVLARARSGAAPYATGSPTGPRDGGTGLRILIAEDHEVNAQLMQLYLRQLGHRSERVADGRAAVAAVRAGDFDVVLMDAQMPVLGGADATAQIRALPGHQPAVIAVTASVLASDRAAFVTAGADDFLSKPVRLVVLDAALGKLFPDVAGRGVPEPPAPGPVDGGVLDADVVDELRDLGDEGFRQVYTRYVDNLDSWVAGLVTAASSPGTAEAEDSAPRLAHRLKGSSASLGATALAALCQRVEHVDDLGDGDRDELLAALRAEGERVAAAVRALLEQAPVPA